ncbi:MAG TPA: flagellar basal body rod protein FlgB [Thermodesulfobacteriota bacterium]|nr:flagellar basal body rod protein FlgB [Thermodesulfobacteriota bacterium]
MEKVNSARSLFDRTIELVERSLDVRTLRHKVLSNNIANAETPNYLSREIPFQKILEHSMGGASVDLIRTHPIHLSADFEPGLETETTQEEVNIDDEMAKLAENNLMFQAGVQSLVKKLQALRTAILEGGQ